MLKIWKTPVIQELTDSEIEDKQVRLFIKREDLIHPFVSGNKWRKLKYNLHEAQELGFKKILTFGGAYSNHIYATAAAAKEFGLQSVGIIRGDELEKKPLNATLQFAEDCGMILKFVTRQVYQKKHEKGYLSTLENEVGKVCVIPEGGTNKLAIKGCSEILSKETEYFDVICSSVGTGGTLSGLVLGSAPHQQVLGFSALKGNVLKEAVKNLLAAYQQINNQWNVNVDYHFGGYAKTTPELITFINNFEKKHQVLLDQVYTGKMMFGIFDLIRKDYFKSGSKILAIHTGGLQGRSLSFD